MTAKRKKHKGRSAAFMRSINPHLQHKRKVYKVHSHYKRMAKKSHYRKARGFNLDFGLGIAPAIYGYGYANFVQRPIDSIVKNFTKSGNFQVADNIARGAALILLKKFIKNPMVSAIVNAGLAVEGAAFSLPQVTSNTNTQNLNTYEVMIG